eukprot:2132053-Rhodomonas_salina.1
MECTAAGLWSGDGGIGQGPRPGSNPLFLSPLYSAMYRSVLSQCPALAYSYTAQSRIGIAVSRISTAYRSMQRWLNTGMA